MKIIVIGGVAAGMSAAAKLKRDNPEYEVIVFEKGWDISYGACGLPYYISGITESEDLLRMRTPKQITDSGIDLRLNTEVISLDEKEKIVTVQNGDVKYIVTYDKCIIATGASPIIPNIEGVDLDNIFTLSNIVDANKIINALDDTIKNVVIVGGGYIGIELVETFSLLGKNIRLIEKDPNIMKTFDTDISNDVKTYLTNEGVDILCNEEVIKFAGNKKVEKIETNKGTYNVDLVVLCVGIRPNTSFLKNTSLDMLPNGAIIVNKYTKTNNDSIYAGGDCATVYHKLLKKNVYIPLGTNSNKQGRFMAVNIAGGNIKFDTVIASSILKVKDLICGRTGLTENEAKENNIDFATNTITSQTNSSYYPGSEPIKIKIVYRKENRVVIGAQLIGKKDICWRVNTLAVCIHNEMTLDQIELLDFAYSPPFSMAWDSIHIAAMTSK